MKIKCKDKFELIRYQIREEVDFISSNYNKIPMFSIIQVGDNEASNRYVKGKINDCNFVGIKPKHIKLDENITEEELIGQVINAQKHCDAIIVQLPLPEHINVENVLSYIRPEKDVDGLTKNSLFEPCTPLGVMCILEDILELYLEGKNVVVLGRSKLVGLPLAHMLQEKNATVTLCHSKTNPLSIRTYLQNADIVISAVGKYRPINIDDINSKAFVIDVGINMKEGKLVGDLPDWFKRYNKTPVPGGVGLMTRAMLLKNIVKAYKMQNGIED